MGRVMTLKLPRHIGIAGNLKYTWHKDGLRKYHFLHHIGKAGNSRDLNSAKKLQIPSISQL
jgi:hypothetical protein